MPESSRTTVLPHPAVLNQGHVPLPTEMMLGLSTWMHIQDPPLDLLDLETAALAPLLPGRMDVVTALMALSRMMGRSRDVEAASGVTSWLLSY